MEYQPNFNDPRVIARVRHAYGFTRGVMSTTKPTRWAKTTINRYLGHQTHQLGRYLRQLLLITTDHHYSRDTGQTKEYLLNASGLDYLRYQLSTPDGQTFAQWAQNNNQQVVQDNNSNSYPSVTLLWDREVVANWALREYGPELQDLRFTYLDKSNRLWHPIQNIKREFKSDILERAGLRHHYDINSAAPTLLMRYAHQLGMETWPQAISEYLEHREEIRSTLAHQLGTDVKTIKIAINALFCGARLGNNPEFALYRLLGTRQRVELLRDNQFIQAIRQDIRDIWNAIQPVMSRKTIRDKNNRERLLPVSSRQKWQIYFSLERQVLDATRKYLIKTNNRHFLEHDGWSTEYPIDQTELSEFIYEQTGFRITLTYHTLA